MFIETQVHMGFTFGMISLKSFGDFLLIIIVIPFLDTRLPLFSGCAAAQAVSHWLPTEAAQAQTWGVMQDRW
jgi:hypothetical protein